MKFTITQTAKGLSTTFARGDYSLVVARLSAIESAGRRTLVLRAFERCLSTDEKTIWNRYWREG